MITVLITKIDNMTDPLEHAGMLQQVSLDRQEKIKHIHGKNDRKRCFAAGILLKKMCEELGIKNPVYEIGKNGKPCMKDEKAAQFNISHSGQYVVLAYNNEGKSLGIDVQERRTLRAGIEDKILSEVEKEKIPKLQKEREEYLFAKWSQKEAFIKMDGRGLSIPLSDLETDELENIQFLKENISASYKEILLDTEYKCFVCCKECDYEIITRVVAG